MNEYEEQANNFLKATSTKFSCKYLDYDFYFPEDMERRNIYYCRLQRGKNSYSFRFGQSIVNTEKNIPPTVYDVLSCLTKSDPGTFKDFCGDYGYNDYEKGTKKIYNAVVKEYEGICRLFSEDEIDLLSEIN